MWRYLKAAFWVGVDMPALGRVPVNLLGVLGFGIVGVAEPALWFIGLGLETTFLFALAFNPRFQKIVEAEHLEVAEGDAEQKRIALVRQLPAESQKRLGELERSCAHVLDLNRQSDEFAVDANQDALQRLEWIYLKLLVARNNLLAAGLKEPEAELVRKVKALEDGMRNSSESEALRHSKAATLAILRERLANVRRREQTLEEIDSDLTRIEAQVALIAENASMQGKPQAISSDIELASNLLSGSLFGDSEFAIADIEEAYSKPKQGTKGTSHETA